MKLFLREPLVGYDGGALAMTLTTTSLEETSRAGKRLGAMLSPGDVVALIGPLGSGKTSLVTGIAKGLGVDKAYSVTSPTFVFAHNYPGKIPLHHIDLYRVEKEEELAQLGLEEMLGQDGVAIVEWFDRFPNLWPTDRMEIRLDFGPNENDREIQAEGVGVRPEKLVKEWGGHDAY